MSARILVVDDQPANVRLLGRILRSDGYSDLVTTTESPEVAELYRAHRPDLILLDLHMPHLDGFAVLQQLQKMASAEAYLPVVVLTADITPEARRRALATGAKDFLVKPFDAAEVLLRIRNQLETRGLHQRLSDRNRDLEIRVSERTAQLERARTEILEHIHRVARNSAMLASKLGLRPGEVELIRRSSTLHDVGKIGIPDAILLKPGKLTSDEFAVIETHTVIGAKILSGSDVPLLRWAEEIARTHHERWDGSGYPSGLSGEGIPIAGRIVAVADVFDALTHDRPYKRAWPLDDAVAEIESQAGRQFDPAVVAAFLGSLRGARAAS